MNLVRAVTRPYPGAFTYTRSTKFLVWQAEALKNAVRGTPPGQVLNVNPFEVACGDGAVRILFGQQERGVYCGGAQLAKDLNVVEGARLESTLPGRRTRSAQDARADPRRQRLHRQLPERAAARRKAATRSTAWTSTTPRSSGSRSSTNFNFHEGDISIHSEWIEYHIKKCDVILPLVAIATPIEYTRNPLRVFELDFEENLRIVRHCVKYGKRVIFPSTSEVYGMCDDAEFDEDTSRLIVGPINKERWIYSTSKQLLDRVIWAYGQHRGLRFTLFRPFNWIGPRLDTLESARIGSSRAITQLISNLVEGSPMQMMDGGAQKRCFTDVSEGIDCLFRIIENEGGRCDGKIFNVGNPNGEASIRELAELLHAKFERHPLRDRFPPFAGIRDVESMSHYGKGYQDVTHRRPSIKNAMRTLGWKPVIPLEDSVERTLDWFLRDYIERLDATPAQAPPGRPKTGAAKASARKAP